MTRTPPEAPFDPGLQPERTLLAWKRTALALVVAGAVAVRFTAPHLGPVAIIFGVAGIVAAALAHILSTRRYRCVHTHLSSGRTLPAGGASVALMAASALIVGLAGLLYVVMTSLSRLA